MNLAELSARIAFATGMSMMVFVSCFVIFAVVGVLEWVPDRDTMLAFVNVAMIMIAVALPGFIVMFKYPDRIKPKLESNTCQINKTY